MMPDIEQIEYFSGLDEKTLGRVKNILHEENYETGENILMEGEKSPGIYFVKSGTVKVYKSSREGREQILKLINPWESFNDVTVFSSSINPASADAVTPARLYLLKGNDLKSLIYEHPEISLNIIKSLTEKLRFLTGRIEDLSLRKVQERIAKMILLFEGQKLSQKLIADIAGTAREVVSRALHDLAAQNIVKIDKRDIIITDREKLKKLVE